MSSLERINESSIDEVNPWKLFKTSEIILAFVIVTKITNTLSKFSSIDLNSISDSDRKLLLTLSDNSVPYEWRKLWHGPKMVSEVLRSLIIFPAAHSNFLLCFSVFKISLDSSANSCKLFGAS